MSTALKLEIEKKISCCKECERKSKIFWKIQESMVDTADQIFDEIISIIDNARLSIPDISKREITMLPDKVKEPSRYFHVKHSLYSRCFNYINIEDAIYEGFVLSFVTTTAGFMVNINSAIKEQGKFRNIHIIIFYNTELKQIKIHTVYDPNVLPWLQYDKIRDKKLCNECREDKKRYDVLCNER